MPCATPVRITPRLVYAAAGEPRHRRRDRAGDALDASAETDAQAASGLPYRGLLAGCVLVLALSAVGDLWAQTLGDRTIRLVVGLAAGSGNDISSRVLADGLQADLGQTVIVENRPGADGAIAVRQVASAVPDGSTLLAGLGSQIVINPAIRADLGYDPKRDLVPVAMVARQPLVLAIHPSVPATTVREFVEYTRTHAGTVNYGAGTSTFMLAAELFKQHTGADMQHIPFSGSGPTMTALLSGTIQAALISGALTIAPAQAGRIRVLAVSGASRLPPFAGVPTFAEAGVDGLDFPVWSAIFAPAGTPREVVDRLNAAIVRVLHSPSVRERFTASAETIIASTPEALAATVASESMRMKEIVARIGLAPR